MATLWHSRAQQLLALRERAETGGGARRMEKQKAAGKLSARERLELLFDAGTFVEVGELVEARINDFGMDARRVPGDGVVTGFGKIGGMTACASSEDFTVIGGTLGEYHSKKICHIMDMAIQMKCPFIVINDSGGARIEEGVASLSGYADIFRRHTQASGLIPQIAVIVGPCAGGACYAPALCDFIFMVRGIGKMFITGPKVVKSVIGEESTPEELGGADVHAEKSGVTHFTFDDERACFERVRELLSYLPQNSFEEPPAAPPHVVNRSEEIESIVPDNLRRAYDVRRVIEALTDEGSFLEIQAEFARNGVIGLARMEGRVIGIVANQPTHMGGSLDCDSSDKMARFVRFCDAFSIPLLTLVDVPAFYPGREQEHKGIIRHGAKLLYAFSEATVPKITLIMRKAYGGAYIAMNSKNIGADLVYAWPIAEIAVMGAEGAVNILYKKEIDAADDPQTLTRERMEAYSEKFCNPFIAARLGYIDDVILPEETGSRIRRAFDVLAEKNKPCGRKHGNIPM